MTTGPLKCLDRQERPIGLKEWLGLWSAAYGPADEVLYQKLIRKHESFTAADFESIGQWKDGALPVDGAPSGRWKPNVASVAFEIWLQVARECPKCPPDNRVDEFLQGWGERRYKDNYPNGTIRDKKFGLSRATTLLHFVSGGRFPIFDSRVELAVKALTAAPVEYSTHGYNKTIRPLVVKIIEQCPPANVRHVDRALFAYGAWLAEIKKQKRVASRKA